MRFTPFYAGALDLVARSGRALEQILVPNGCAFCGGDLPPRDPPVCAGCYRELPWVGPKFHLDPFIAAATPLEYAFPVDAAVKRLKFHRKLFYVKAFTHLLGPAIRELPDDIDALLPMPLHWRRQAARGFNQANEISRWLRRAMNLPVVNNVYRGRHTPYQSGLTAEQRKRNVRQAFRVKGSLNFRHVLIFDDVITTGETCRELARAVCSAGVEKVSALAIARAVQG